MAVVCCILKHKLTQFIFVLVLATYFFQNGIPALSFALTDIAAPVPAHLLWGTICSQS